MLLILYKIIAAILALVGGFLLGMYLPDDNDK